MTLPEGREVGALRERGGWLLRPVFGCAAAYSAWKVRSCCSQIAT